MKQALRDGLLLVIVLLLVFPMMAWASDGEGDEDYEYRTWRMPRSHAGFNGHGGFFFGIQPFDSGDLEDLATAMNVDKLDGPMYYWGGYGMGHVGKGWRIGGGGHGGSVRSTGTYTANDGQVYNQTLELDMGMGGFMVEYSPWMIGPLNMGVGTMLGGGGVNVRMRRDTGHFTWEDLSGQFIGEPSEAENIATDVYRPFFVAEPYFILRLFVLDWMALEGKVGYHLDTMNTDGWLFIEDEISSDGPDIDLNKPFFRIGMTFGG